MSVYVYVHERHSRACVCLTICSKDAAVRTRNNRTTTEKSATVGVFDSKPATAEQHKLNKIKLNRTVAGRTALEGVTIIRIPKRPR